MKTTSWNLIKLSILLVFSNYCNCDSDSGDDFCYDEGVENCPDPKDWGGWCNNNAGRQSPIDIKVTHKKAKPAFVPGRPSLKASSFYSRNNGEGVTIRFTLNTTKGEPCRGILSRDAKGLSRNTTYCLDNVHFHWGTAATNGSEHSINGKQSALEIHFVHYNSEYDSVNASLVSGDKNAVAVAAVLCKGTSSKTSKALAPVVEQLGGQLKEISKDFVLVNKTLNLASLIPSHSFVYHYEGSLTTPECAEQVDWYVFSDTHTCQISESDLEKFRSVKGRSRTGLLKENHRPLQPLNGRTIDTFKLYY